MMHRIVLLLVAALMAGAVGAQHTATSFTFDHIRYTFYPGEIARSWGEADAFCLSLNKELAVFANRAQIRNVSEYLSPEGGVWTGYKTNADGRFEAAELAEFEWKKELGTPAMSRAKPGMCGLLSVANYTGIVATDCDTKKAALCSVHDPDIVEAETMLDVKSGMAPSAAKPATPKVSSTPINSTRAARPMPKGAEGDAADAKKAKPAPAPAPKPSLPKKAADDEPKPPSHDDEKKAAGSEPKPSSHDDEKKAAGNEDEKAAVNEAKASSHKPDGEEKKKAVYEPKSSPSKPVEDEKASDAEKKSSDDEKKSEDDEKKAADKEKKADEDKKKAADEKKKAADEKKKAADEKKAADDKKKAEDDKKKAEDDKKKAEDDKKKAEDDKKKAEDDKKKAEDDKKAAASANDDKKSGDKDDKKKVADAKKKVADAKKKVADTDKKKKSGAKAAAATPVELEEAEESSAPTPAPTTRPPTNQLPVQIESEGCRFTFFPNHIMFGGYMEYARFCEDKGLQPAVFTSRRQLDDIAAHVNSVVMVWTGYTTDSQAGVHSVDERHGPWDDEFAVDGADPAPGLSCGAMSTAEGKVGITMGSCASAHEALCSAKSFPNNKPSKK